MPEPFALLTADPRFNPNEPVTVNGFLYQPASEGGRHEVAAPPNNAGKAGQGSRVDGRVIPARPDYAALGLGSEWESEGRN
jgi:hypothetical protein